MKTMKLSDIKIVPAFAATIPREEKVNKCRYAYLQTGEQDRVIVVNHNDELVDGYVMYKVLQDLGVEDAEIKVSEKKKDIFTRKCRVPDKYRSCMTTYVYGVHPGENAKKERVWRVPGGWNGWADDVLPGDTILVSTKRGVAPITVTKIQWLEKAPINRGVNRVVKKFK